MILIQKIVYDSSLILLIFACSAWHLLFNIQGVSFLPLVVSKFINIFALLVQGHFLEYKSPNLQWPQNNCLTEFFIKNFILLL